MLILCKEVEFGCPPKSGLLFVSCVTHNPFRVLYKIISACQYVHIREVG
jgi:hypothetical protein